MQSQFHEIIVSLNYSIQEIPDLNRLALLDEHFGCSH